MTVYCLEHSEKEDAKFKVAILIKFIDLKQKLMEEAYIDPLEKLGIPRGDMVSFSLKYYKGKAPVSMIRAHLQELLKGLDSLGATTLLVADSAYFKTLTGSRTSEPHHGYILPCKIKGYEHFNVILSINYKALFHNPKLQFKLDMSLNTLANYLQGTHTNLGVGIIHSEYYPSTAQEIQRAIDGLYKYPAITCDIEAFSLNVHTARIGTIAFAWDQHNGFAFPVCLDWIGNPKSPTPSTLYIMLKRFFINYTGNITYHNGTFDIKVLIYELFMNDALDQVGLLKGLEVMYQDVDDTKLITYLATNTTAGNNLKLKSNAFEFAGNWAQDEIKNITLIPKPELLRYNLIDALATWYVKNKNYPVMVADQQEQIYRYIFLPSMKVITQMELTGMPIDMHTVDKVELELKHILDLHMDAVNQSPLIWQFEKYLRMEAVVAKNAKLKKKVVYEKDFASLVYNPASNKQTRALLYDEFDFKIIDKTDTGLAAVGGKTIKKLLNHCNDPDQATILKALIGIAEVSIILNTFIKAFKKATLKADGIYYLHGNFNLGGTVSGRLSSSKPNLTNIPSNSKYGKLIKTCFIAPPGWLFVGIDFWSLEDRISALTTKDPNKLKVYEGGYDGHCLRAYSYFGAQMPGITDTVSSINSISTLFPDLRQRSKGPTFALTYQGTWRTLVENLGLVPKEAQQIEENYHELYTVSDAWVRNKLEEASHTGFITGAFGLRLRTPILSQTLLGKRSTPYAATAEGRTAGNMFGQSWGMLNNRAAIEFQRRTLASPYALLIKPICQIHDSQYFLIRDKISVVHWFNKTITKCLAWQNHPDIQHSNVSLGGDCCIHYPNWAHEIALPNDATPQEIMEICKNGTNTHN